MHDVGIECWYVWAARLSFKEALHYSKSRDGDAIAFKLGLEEPNFFFAHNFCTIFPRSTA